LEWGEWGRGVAAQFFQALERQEKMSAPLRRNDAINLVNDNRFNRSNISRADEVNSR